jgi:outer membrane lipoprotein SlyB
MKTRIIILALAVLALCGCSSPKKLAADLAEYEKLGVREVVINGKFSHTDYTVNYANGQRIAVVNHTNPWISQIKIVRVTPETTTTNP